MRRLRLTPAVIAGGGLMLALTIVAFVVMVVAITHQRDSSRKVNAADQRIALANQLIRRVIDIETGQRGFIITNRARFLGPRRKALRVLPNLERDLLSRERESGDPGHLARLRRIYSEVDAYIHDYSTPLVVAAEQDLGSARRIVIAGEGRRRVDRLRADLRSYVRRETASSGDLGSDAGHSGSTAIALAIIGLILLPLLLIGLISLISRSVADPIREAAKAAERLRAGDLTVRVKERGLGEVRTLALGFNEMATSLERNRDKLESQNAELEAQQDKLEQSVAELAEQRDQIQDFHDFVSRLAANNQIGPLGDALVEELTAVAGADAAVLYAIEPTIPDQTELLRLVASSGFEQERLDRTVERGQGLAGRALLEEGIVIGDHGESGLELHAFGQTARVSHELHLPIGRPGGMIAVVSLVKLGEHGFSDDRCERLLEMTGPAGVALANALSLERSEQTAALNRAVLESAQDAYLAVDQDGILQAWSPEAGAMYGYSEEEALGEHLAELVMPDDAAAKQAHDARRAEIIAKGMRGERLERYESLSRRRDGSALLCEVTASVVRAGSEVLVTYFVRDVTDRALRAHEREAREAVARVLAESGEEADLIQPIIAALGESFDWPLGGFWEIGDDRTVRCSRIWVSEDLDFPQFAGYARAITYAPGGEVPDFPILKEAWDSESLLWDVPEVDLSQRQVVAGSAGLRASLALPVRSNQGMLGLLTFGSRTSTPPDGIRLTALRSIADLIGQVMERRRAEQDAERLKSEFFALVSHELRTPLTSITGYLEIVRAGDAGEINEKQRHYLGVIDRNARRLQRLVGDLLFVAQVEAGRMPLNREQVELEKIAAEAVEAAEPQAEKKGVELSVDAQPASIEGDGGRLGQLVDNLISNAIKFTPQGGKVSVSLSNGGPSAVIEITDTGMGISAADQESLFDRFYRTDDAAKLAIPGIGLGLSISKAIAEGHGGTIAVRSSEGRGTTFRVELPLNGRAEALDTGSNGQRPNEGRLVRG